MSDLEHTNEFGEIEAFRDTKYWFRRDLQTIKKSSIITFNRSPIIFLATILFSFLLSVSFNDIGKDLGTLFANALSFFPIFLLAHFMFHVIFTKGYNVHQWWGTYIDNPKFEKRFSIKYILDSKMSKGRKIIFLLRLAFIGIIFITYLIMFISKWV